MDFREASAWGGNNQRQARLRCIVLVNNEWQHTSSIFCKSLIHRSQRKIFISVNFRSYLSIDRQRDREICRDGYFFGFKCYVVWLYLIRLETTPVFFFLSPLPAPLLSYAAEALLAKQTAIHGGHMCEASSASTTSPGFTKTVTSAFSFYSPQHMSRL